MTYYLNGENSAELFALRQWLVSRGHCVVFPLDVRMMLPELPKEALMKLLYGLIDLCDCVLIPKGWERTQVGKAEYEYAKSIGKEIHFESKQWSIKSVPKTKSEKTTISGLVRAKLFLWDDIKQEYVEVESDEE